MSTSSHIQTHHQVLIAGGGLAGGLLAWRLAELEPELDFLVLEQEALAGGNHTWCFHQQDLNPEAFSWIEPLISASWSAHTVEFPGLSRKLHSGYFAIRSEDFASRLKARLGKRLVTGQTISSLDNSSLQLADSSLLTAGLVFDARGPGPVLPGRVAWQKFLGLELELAEPHGLSGPVLMDARVPQLDGFRFMYLLPWGPNRLLIEDTRYSTSPELDLEQSEALILDYARERGWRSTGILRREQGCLPLPLQREFMAPADPLALGLRSGLFHCVTGYSLPESVRLVDWLTSQSQAHGWQADRLIPLLSDYRQRWRQRQDYLLLLNRMLFKAAVPEERWRVLARFYTLSEALIQRFYAGRLTPLDRFRLLAGRPPVPVGAALTCLAEGRPI